MKIQVTGSKDKPHLFIYLPKRAIQQLGLKKGMELDYRFDSYEEGELKGLPMLVIHKKIEHWD